MTEVREWPGKPTAEALAQAVEEDRAEVAEALGGDVDISARGLLWYIHPPLGVLGMAALCILILVPDASLTPRVVLGTVAFSGLTVAYFGVHRERTHGLRTQLWFKAVEEQKRAHEASRLDHLIERWKQNPLRAFRSLVRRRRIEQLQSEDEAIAA